MLDLLQKIGGVGRRLAEAGRKPGGVCRGGRGITDQMTRALGAAAGEVIGRRRRCCRDSGPGCPAAFTLSNSRSKIRGTTTTSSRQEWRGPRDVGLVPEVTAVPAIRLSPGGQARCGRLGPRNGSGRGGGGHAGRAFGSCRLGRRRRGRVGQGERSISLGLTEDTRSRR